MNDANINAVANGGRTPLGMAIQLGQDAVAELLRREGAVESTIRPEEIAKLIDQLRDQATVSEATVALGKIGPAAKAAIPALAELAPLHADTLGMIGPAAVPILVELLGQGDIEGNAVAASRALRLMGGGARGAVPALMGALKNPSIGDDARLHVLLTLGAIGSDASEATPLLLELLRATSEDTRWGAVQALAQIAPTATTTVAALIELCTDSAPSMRGVAANALGSIGPTASAAIPALKELLADEYWAVRGSAVRALVQIERHPG